MMVPAAHLAAAALTVVQANVGNINGACAEAKFKLCQAPVEQRAATALRAIKPDVVGFEEIQPEMGPPAQPARLLGPGYAVQCDRRFGWDCLAVRKASGVKIVGRLRTRRVVGGCTDTGFTLNRATLRYRSHPIAVSVAHPDSSATRPRCRADQVKDLFSTFSRKGRVLALGDFNLDPFREKDVSVTTFRTALSYLGMKLVSGRTVSLMPGSSMSDPTGTALDDGYTMFPSPLSGRTVDLVATRGITGTCRVRRIDGGGGMDHRAQVCRLRV